MKWPRVKFFRQISAGGLCLFGTAACNFSSPPEEPDVYVAYKASELRQEEREKESTVVETHLSEKYLRKTQLSTLVFHSIDKRNKLAQLVAAYHYKEPNLKEVYSFTHSSEELNKYLYSLDPYSRYFSKKQNEFSKERSKASRVGIGIKLLIHQDGILTIPISDAPLFRLGLAHPKYLVSLNNKQVSYNDFSSYRVLTELRHGQSLSIKIKDAGGERSYFPRASRFDKKTVAYYEKNDTGILSIYEFGEKATVKIRQYSQKAGSKKKLVIDLRYSPGGDLFSTIDTLAFFLKSRKDIAYLKKASDGSNIDLESLPNYQFKNEEIYLITSKFTASSAEVFIRALKKYRKKVTIVGEPTVGKCLAQEQHLLDDGSSLSLSAYEIFTSRMQPCQGVPIVPDRIVPNIELLSIDDIVKL